MFVECPTVLTQWYDPARNSLLAAPTSSSNDSTIAHGCTFIRTLQPTAVSGAATAASHAQPARHEFRWKQWISHAAK